MDEKPVKIEISEKLCKACYICIEYCPTKVLAMEGMCASVVNLDACIKCMQCELRCPDFAIKVIV